MEGAALFIINYASAEAGVITHEKIDVDSSSGQLSWPMFFGYT